MKLQVAARIHNIVEELQVRSSLLLSAPQEWVGKKAFCVVRFSALCTFLSEGRRTLEYDTLKLCYEFLWIHSRESVAFS